MSSDLARMGLGGKRATGCKGGRAFLIQSYQTALAYHSLLFFIGLNIRKGVGNENAMAWLGLELPAPEITSSKGRDISSGQRGMKTQLRETFIVQGPDLVSFYTRWEKPWPHLRLWAG